MPGSSWDRWKAQCGLYRGLSPGDFHRPEKPLPRTLVPLWVPSPEIYDYLRLLYARIGIPHCPICGKVIEQQTVDQMVDRVLVPAGGNPYPDPAPVVRQRKGEHAKEFESARRSGYVRVRVDGNLYDLSEEIKLEKNKKHTIEIVVDRLVIKEDIHRRLTDSVETAAALAGGLVVINIVGEDRDILFSQNYACEDCGVSIEELTPACSPSTTPSAPAPPAPAWAAR